MLTTFLLGATFLFVQINEYVHLGVAAHDTAQMSVFYGLTGLHGAHVFIGLILLSSSTSAPSAGTTRPRSTGASRSRASTGTSSTSCGWSSTRRSTCSRCSCRPLPSAGEPAPLGGGGLPLPDLRGDRHRGDRRADPRAPGAALAPCRRRSPPRARWTRSAAAGPARLLGALPPPGAHAGAARGGRCRPGGNGASPAASWSWPSRSARPWASSPTSCSAPTWASTC